LETNIFQKFYHIVCTIPPGRVATYGQVAILAGKPHSARMVGWALANLSPEDDVPWHRVVNAMGKISLPRGQGYEVQRALLEAEGIHFGPHDHIDLERYGWEPQVT
jgi:methylated-DNA-protein-cysteine methyltransferase-like protein